MDGTALLDSISRRNGLQSSDALLRSLEVLRKFGGIDIERLSDKQILMVIRDEGEVDWSAVSFIMRELSFMFLTAREVPEMASKHLAIGGGIAVVALANAIGNGFTTGHELEAVLRVLYGIADELRELDILEMLQFVVSRVQSSVIKQDRLPRSLPE